MYDPEQCQAVAASPVVARTVQQPRAGLPDRAVVRDPDKGLLVIVASGLTAGAYVSPKGSKRCL